ncbi:alanine racemase C-terminal domain-containing protein [Lacisediminihabitans changchengi]|uniref:Alanine racemase n=1 Tax=Lacisediminihabitans changchengi TaxID=2787634 RepID=A0A934SMP2_9MICO|nr:alanine racemase C-terminal domain-containing protein [Lacisediminihabitans changchengi]MBK4346718.1 alanine racemase [Lacisediminihabitans changchengi]MBK4348159.1 alanine racemase [Lacisediminihabitans changchengi]
MQSSHRHALGVEPAPVGRHRLRVDLEAIRHNTAVLLSRGRPVLADVSADGYGHGAAEVARVATEAGATSIDGERGESNLALYGMTDDPALRPAMRVSAVVVATKTIDAGEGVSYGLTYRATARTNLALVGIGYADGLDRSASNTASLLLNGTQRRIVGRVAMNALVLELGDDTAQVGDEAVVFGDPAAGDPHVREWAASIGRPPAEVTAVIGLHLPRSYA